MTRHENTKDAVGDFAEHVHADDYNSAWLLVGDRRSLYYLQMGGAGSREVEMLDPGLYVLANDPLHGSSPKTDHVRDQIEGIADLAHPEQLRLLRSVLADHSVPPAVPTSAGKSDRPVELAAACVHTDGYGTRSAALVSVPAEGFPHMWVADGPPCRTPFIEVDEPWSTSA